MLKKPIVVISYQLSSLVAEALWHNRCDHTVISRHLKQTTNTRKTHWLAPFQDFTFVARIEHPPTGRFMEIHSDQPSVIFFTGNYIHGLGHPDMIGKGSVLYGRYGGLCLETMNLVDANFQALFLNLVTYIRIGLRIASVQRFDYKGSSCEGNLA